jgi:hypothetical protein
MLSGTPRRYMGRLPRGSQWFHGSPPPHPSRSVVGMKRASILVVVAFVVVACAGSPSSQPPDQSQAAGQSQAQGASQAPSSGGGGGGGGGAALAAAAKAVTDWCTLMPADLAAKLVPGAAHPQSADFPKSCTVSNQVQALQVSYQSFSGAQPDPAASPISGLGEHAWLAVGYPVDDAYLTVILFTDPNGLGASTLYVEMAGHDGIDHGKDAIDVAKAVIAQLH